MARILYAWELGGNSGHLLGFAPIAAELERRGHQLLYAVRDLRGAAAQFAGSNVLIAQAPHAPRIARRHQPPASYAELLALVGYSDATALAGMVRGWLDLIRLFRAQVVVADYAPTASLAARIARLPCVRLDLGFMRPPRREPLPSMLPWQEIPSGRLAASEARVLERVNAVMRAHGSPALGALADLLEAQENFLLTFPELDHYADRAGERYDGPFYVDSLGEARGWPKGNRPKVLAYLRPGPGLEAALEGIASTGAVAHCFVPGASRELAARLASRDIHISATPLRLKELLPGANATVSYGSHGYVSAALLAGVPCIVLPSDVEKAGLARRIVQARAGAAVNAKRSAVELEPALNAVLSDARYAGAARAFAQRHAAHRPDRLPARIAAAIDETAARAR